MQSKNALSTAEHVQAIADCFFQIADLLHRRLTSGALNTQSDHATTELYSLLVEEYGLRARAAILRNDAATHRVTNCNTDQQQFLYILQKTGIAIASIHSLDALRSIISDVSTLCVGISPGKGPVIDFLLDQLCRDLADC